MNREEDREFMKDMYKILREDCGDGVPDPLYWTEGIYIFPDGTVEHSRIV